MLTHEHIERIVNAYKAFKDEPGFTRVATLDEIRAKEGNLSIPLYGAATPVGGVEEDSWSYKAGGLGTALSAWLESSNQVRQSLEALLPGVDRKQEDR